MWVEQFQDGCHISDRNNLSNSESPKHQNASLKVSAQPVLPFGSRFCLKTIKMAAMVAILDIATESFWAVLNLCVALMLSTKFGLNCTYREQITVKDFKNACHKKMI